MKIVGCDLHTCYQPIAMLDQETGESVERRREHTNGEERAFYTELEAAVRVGITGTLKTVNIDRQRPAQPCFRPTCFESGWYPTLPDGSLS
jgi:hypothetical protein